MNEHWYLRHGDFRPEKLQSGETLGYPNAQITLEQLSNAGNLFASEQDAIEASIAVRSELQRLRFIRQERQGYNRRNGKHPDSNQPLSSSSRLPQTPDEEILSHGDEP
ncbi:MAG: hypothetical protein NC411_10530 [Bacteroides sp.]|nr:hypothetical protein [Bacteroides sp.]